MQAGIIRMRDRVGDSLELWLATLSARTSHRSRLTGSVILALMLHGLLLWMLIATHPDIWNLDSQIIEEPFLPAEIWDVPPPPKPEVTPEPAPVIVPRDVQQPDIPQPVDEAPRETEQAPPAVVPQPVVQPQPVKPITVTLPKEKPLDIAAPATVADAPPSPSMSARARKKAQEELDAKAQDSIGQVSDLNLHETPDINMQALQKVAPSGLAPANGGGRLGAMQPPAGLPSGTGTLKGGRGQVTQALQNHDWCVSTQKAGKPLPADCRMSDLAGQKGMGPKPDAGLQAAVAKKDKTLRYKTSPGNDAYWKRVTHVPTAADQRDQAPQPGAYSNAKDQRNMGNGGGTADPKSEAK